MNYWLHKKGSKGQEIKRIQKLIGELKVDGTFGATTEEAIKEYQLANKLNPDGVVGPETRKSLKIEIFPGIDISKWNKIQDWRKIKDTGLAKFCWVKATEGNNFLCNMFQKHYDNAKQVGIPAGAYHFARPDLHLDPYKEVANFVKHCPIEKGDLRPVLDFEKAGEHDPDSIRDWVLTFLKEFEIQSGVRPIIYTGGNMTKYYLKGDTKGIDEYTLWHAYYSLSAHQ